MHGSSTPSPIPELSNPGRGRYWRSLDDLSANDTLLARIGDEFAPDADVWLDPTSRRNFLKIMGASIALAGITGCSDFPDEEIIPYVNQPESVIPGQPTFYSTAFPFCGYALGALAESHEGRPTKIEGNPDHPATLGASNVFMQASVLDLYDPDRSRVVTHAGVPTSWGAFVEFLNGRLMVTGEKGAGLRLLTRTITSPTFASQLAQLRQRFPAAQWHVHDPTAHAGCSGRNGGAPGQAVYDFSKAAVILSLDADFVFSDVGSIRYARQFIDGRRRQPGLDPAQQKMNRLYVIESGFSMTGSMADHRRAVRPSEVLPLAQAIAAKLGVPGAGPDNPPPGMESFVAAVADDLKKQAAIGGANPGGGGLVVAGDHHPPQLQALAHAMNVALGSVGNGINYIDPVDVQGAKSLEDLVNEIRAGTVQALLILGGNPVYDSPAEVPFEAELRRLSVSKDASGRPACLTAYLGFHDNETAFNCQWHLPESHYLEAWGDARAFDGSAAIIQPLILPFSSASKSILEIMQTLLGHPDAGGYEVVRSYWKAAWNKEHPGEKAATQPATTQPATGPTTSPRPRSSRAARTFEEWWTLVLRKGHIEGSEFPPLKSGANQPLPPGSDSAGAAASSPADWDLLFRPDAAVWDGQFANNAWLAELPQPFTKLVWDCAGLVSYRSAKRMGLNDYDTVHVIHDGRALAVPILIVPGLADQTLVLPLGYGRTRGGHVALEGGTRIRGYNAYSLRTRSGDISVGAKVTRSGEPPARLVVTRSHHAMANLPADHPSDTQYDLKPDAIEHPGDSRTQIELDNRKLVRSGTLDGFKNDPDWVVRLGGEVAMKARGLSPESQGRKIQLTIYPNPDEGGWDYSKGHQWGMSIDQTACVGCNACVIACQSENNISVVGKDECGRQREMHWIRIDDWFGGQPSGNAEPLVDPQVIHMPVPCQHCEDAPCELVCPVGATTHSVEGINEMTYNRCVGTRFCSNNCPYKVRRFNFLLFADYNPTRSLQYNPEVTVRSRGVMEKCNYCVQRVNRTRMEIEKLTVRLEERARDLESQSPDAARSLRDSLIARRKDILENLQTACQQACPTEAIHFGDKNEPGSRISNLKDDKLDYTLLDELTTLPRTSYMARLSNPNPAL